MKKIILNLTASIMIGMSGMVNADTVITEVGVPITVENDSWSYVAPDYYYYSGHRCYVKERPDLGVKVAGIRATVSGGETIYCYPYK